MPLLPPILVVEDHDDTRTMLVTFLESQGYRTVTARNGAEALSVGRASNPCLILLDLMMPVMSGEQFLIARASLPVLRQVPVIILSASPYAEIVSARYSADGCVAKPLDLDRVSAIVERQCPKPRTGRAV
jgi:CheY-like chemotaxis protein